MRVNRLSATFLAAVLLSVVATAQSPLKPVQFSDTRLANGLRVIISEDHYAPIYAIAVSYKRRVEGRAPGANRLCPSLRAHDVQRIGEHRTWRALLPDLQLRRQHERHDQHRSHALLRSDAEEPARPRAVPRIRSDAFAGDHKGQPRQPAPGGAGRAAAAPRQPAVRQIAGTLQRARLRQLRLQALGHRIDGGSERRHSRRRRRIFPYLLRAEQCGARHRRRRRHEGDARQGREVLRQHPAPAEPGARWISPSGT